MDISLEHIVTVFLGFFAVMNPLANTAVFVGLTAKNKKKERVILAFRSLMISFFVIAAFALLGKGIFHLFGITLQALRITGGILVFLIGYHMLQGQPSSLHSSEQEEKKDLAVSPLAIPILAGPGTIATAMNYSASGGWTEIAITMAMFFLLCVITFICFVSGQKIIGFLGSSGLGLITRLMGLILAVIGTQLVIISLIQILK
eukprot:COSAG01_NODE_2485_length_7594_cov_36.632021_10_plen_203_part_00